MRVINFPLRSEYPEPLSLCSLVIMWYSTRYLLISLQNPSPCEARRPREARALVKPRALGYPLHIRDLL